MLVYWNDVNIKQDKVYEMEMSGKVCLVSDEILETRVRLGQDERPRIFLFTF